MHLNYGKDMPLVSVVIPTFNRKHIVGKAIESAINQTYKHIEIIVVDDGSSDGSAEFIAGYGSAVKYIFKENGGVSSARNLGIRKSIGEFVAFLDSDDVWLPDKLEKQIHFFEKNPDFGMVLCDCYYMDSSSKISERSMRRNCLPRDGHILNDVFMSPSLIPSSVLVKKAVLDDIGCFDEDMKTAEDLDLHLKIAVNYKIGLISEPLFNYMVGHDGLSKLTITYDDHVFIVERFIQDHPTLISESLARKALFQTFLGAANGKYMLKSWWEGIRYTIKTFRCITSINDMLAALKLLLKGFKYFLKGITTRSIVESDI
jgi:glycosyltransferase involved in cell wall biosynthesis